jgi:CheY-like chemotaxis protein
MICADDIRDTLTRHKFTTNDTKVIGECIKSANNIALCVQPQKAIVDDVLTVSKLDSNLLLITPVPVQPVTVIHRAMSMFKPEAQTKDIRFEFCPHHSMRDLDVDWVHLDPSRLLQITVNLITNAIKFTQTSATRVISVHLGASLEQPDLQNKGFEFVPTKAPSVNITAGKEWGDGERLYIRVQVQDTGCGLTAEEKQQLFQRFAQASPRTHAHYGGSGLGLFISRQLAELHGGQIGVSSEDGVGSTFAFFIQARRVTSPVDTATNSCQPLLQLPPKDAIPHQNETRAVAIDIPPLSAITPETPKNPEFATEALHVLIVEDNLVNQKVLSRQLEKAGCIVSTADNGIYALSHLATTEFQTPGGTPLSVILMDLEMPEMDGLTCVARIREMEAQGVIVEHVPVIAVMANVRAEQITHGRNSGMDDVVSKPFRVQNFLLNIRNLLDQLKSDVAI